MIKIALINPPVSNDKNWVREGRCQQLDIWGAPFPPFTLAMISRGLVDSGCETIIIDAGAESKNINFFSVVYCNCNAIVVNPIAYILR